ncbi:phosphonate metabolism protein/1,5-bisphosphokinase (PRPP-forming) PhnN [Microvirga sp. VF16]|uniref:phosphonate metabolism protein/1,5-bisphosphokinase (PRPP-forming) PhnN n=1 Tax=Microvirga sp. VF16 TaxID=2807101 RepID=UPI00193E7C78|nr:phosphonate metabolism protein/1,5-bisphosphokinase (PRPP-forming) PhnN [Microvirga sp. VF16]QRM32802.1 phosphonate metabolism protein/1,5-bisphosphokinase (PRPP-forming) PhnN [Microvirga sp. VF16]
MTNPGFSGQLVLVVGPSGAGKDTLIDYAKERLQHDDRIRFVRRVITRPASVGEDHDPVDLAEFRKQVESEAFALYWEAHGLHYGLPNIIDDWLAQGHVVVANGSRAILPEARRRYATLQVISIAASPTVLAQRLERRGRERHESRKARLARSDKIDVNLDDALAIDNSGELSFAGNQLVEVLQRSLPADPDSDGAV